MKALGQGVRIIGTAFGMMILGLIVRVFLPGVFQTFGLYPRDFSNIGGVIGMHFIHANLTHFISNMLGFLPLSIILFIVYPKAAKFSYILIPIIAGLLLWVLGRPVFHVGASAWVYGLVSYLITAGWVSKRFWNILLSLAIALFYSGMIFGILPVDSRISWEGHLFGAIAGIIVAILSLKRTRSQEHAAI